MGICETGPLSVEPASFNHPAKVAQVGHGRLWESVELPLIQ